MSAPRLVATDLDGTLLGPGGTVSASTAAALTACEEAGVDVVFVTARPLRWLAEVAGLVGKHGIAICTNGAAVVEVATSRILEEHGMPPELVAELAGRLRSAGGGPRQVHLAVERSAGFAMERGYPSEHPVPAGTPVGERIESVLTASTLKMLVRRTDRASDLDGFVSDVAEVVGDRAEVSHSGASGLVEINAHGVTKASTLARWVASRGVRPDEVWAVGDAPNDLPMLAWAGVSFAVANAHPRVLAAVDRVVPSNEEGGVAVVLAEARRLAAAEKAT